MQGIHVRRGKRLAWPGVLLVASAMSLSVGCVRPSQTAENDVPKQSSKADQHSVGSAEKTSSPKSAVAAYTIELIIDYGDGVQKRFNRLPWREHLTAFDALAAGKSHPHGITFVSRGNGDTAFVTQVDDLKNEGGGDDAKNWVFRINDHLVDKGCGVAEVRPGDVILWKFGAYE